MQSKGDAILMEKILEFHELDWIYALVTIAARKNNTTVPKLKSLLQEMRKLDKPICKIIVEEKIE